MKKTSKNMSVVTLPLKTERWQEDILFKRFELCRSIYNAMLGYEWKQYRKMCHEPLYKDAMELIVSVCKVENPKEKRTLKKDSKYRAAVESQRMLFCKYGFSEFDFIKTVGSFYRPYSMHISSNMAGLSIAKPMWTAFEKMLFGNGRTVHFKKYDTWKSIVSDGKSGIRMVNESGNTIFYWNGDGQLYVLMGGRYGKKLKMPVKIDFEDHYLLDMLDRDIKTVRIIRKKVRGNYKYYVQLCVEGAPAVKYDIETGEIKHPIGIGRVGIYVDATSLTIFSNQGRKYYDLSQEMESYEHRRIELQRYMDNSRRATNPENYHEDGTIKKGQWKNGRRVPLHWSYSKGYIKAKNELANLYRIAAEQRRLQINRLANGILALGCEVVVNDVSNQSVVTACIARLDQKLKVNGYAGVERVQLENIDDSIVDYREHYAKLLYEGNY